MSEQQGAPAPAAEPPETSPPAGGLWRLPRRLLARYLRLLARHRFVGCLFGLIVLLSLCGLTLAAARLISPRSQELAPLEETETNEVGSLIIANEDGVEAYLDAMEAFDAQKMWDAYADSARADLAARGRSVEELQRGLAQAQQSGARIDGWRSLGTYPLRDGRRFVFYIVRRSGFPPDGSPEELYFIFTVDPSGRILNIT